MVKIRLKRFGRKHLPFWRINAIDTRTSRDGKVLEELGFYDPTLKDTSRQVVVNKARVEHWLKAGAQPSDTVRTLLDRALDEADYRASLKQPKATAAAPAETPAQA